MTNNITVNWPDETDASLSDLIAIRKELQAHLRELTCAIEHKVAENHPEFLKIDWNRINKLGL